MLLWAFCAPHHRSSTRLLKSIPAFDRIFNAPLKCSIPNCSPVSIPLSKTTLIIQGSVPAKFFSALIFPKTSGVLTLYLYPSIFVIQQRYLLYPQIHVHVPWLYSLLSLFLSHQGEPISFCQDTFLQQRSGAMQVFLQQAVDLQLFKQVRGCGSLIC